jgi:hypothetical protein
MSQPNSNNFNDLTEMERVKDQLEAFKRRQSRARAQAEPFVRKDARRVILADYKKMHDEAFR